jgi:hypothetical protein
MTYENLFQDGALKQDIPSGDLSNLFNAIMKVYPMIVFSNLTKNKYFMIRDEGFLYNDITSSGVYDDLIDDNVANIHANYQEIFVKCFSRKNLLHEYDKGKTDVYAELYQKDQNGKYRWVSTHTIRIQDDSGDVVQICFNRPLDGVEGKSHPHF